MKRAQSIVPMGLLLVLFVVFWALLVVEAAATVGEHCSNDFQKVVTCLAYATGKAAEPTKECCSSVTEIKDNDPVCLCYVIQQTHNGGEEAKSMGIQESRLLQLPSACKLTNASASDCPKLLNITASSPDYKIFVNSSASSNTTPATTTVGTSLPTPTKATDGSSGSKLHGPQLSALVVPVAMALFFVGLFPVEEVSSKFHTCW